MHYLLMGHSFSDRKTSRNKEYMGFYAQHRVFNHSFPDMKTLAQSGHGVHLKVTILVGRSYGKPLDLIAECISTSCEKAVISEHVWLTTETYRQVSLHLLPLSL
ncbi:hypothetical protein OTU49_008011 [Cherax quadricarinatus]|uniref:Uncharacterized protein n=1 Tax=Cherax quadricarinatus TaxID=27406 RepID=A0AAW0WRT6_CHEQU